MKNLFYNMLALQPGISIAILLLIGCRRLMKRKYAAKLRYWLWLVIALRLLLPVDVNFFIGRQPAVNIPVREYYITRSDATVNFELVASDEKATEMQPNVYTQPTENKIVKSRSKPASTLVLAVKIWLSVAVVALTVTFTNYFRAKSDIKKSMYADKGLDTALEKVKIYMGINKNVKIAVSPRVYSPMLIGIINPVIVLPRENYNSENIDMILAHELTHLKRNDVLYKFIVHITVCVYWFNPLIALMAKYAGRDIEISCDEQVVRYQSKEFKTCYAEAIMQVITYNKERLLLSTTFSRTGKTLKERFANIFTEGKLKGGKNILAGFMALVIIATTVVGCGNTPVNTKPRVAVIKQSAVSVPLDLKGKMYSLTSNTHQTDFTGRILVTDLENNQTEYFCDNENCDHNNDSCTAYIGATACYLNMLADGKTLLLLARGYVNDRRGYVLSTIDTETKEHSVLHQYTNSCFDPSFASNMIQINDVLYIAAESAEGGYIIKINLTTKEAQYFFAGEKNMVQIIGADEKNIYLYDYSHPENGKQNIKRITVFDVSRETYNPIYTLETDRYIANLPSYGNKVYLYELKDGKVVLNEFDLQTRELKNISLDLIGIPVERAAIYYMTGNTLIINAAEKETDSGFDMYYNVDTGQKGIVEMKNRGMTLWPISKYGAYFLVDVNPVNLQIKAVGKYGSGEIVDSPRDFYSFIRCEDYYNNNPRFMYLDYI